MAESNLDTLERRTDDYSRDAVPPDALVSGSRIFFVLMSGGIALPVLVMGSQLGVALGTRACIVAAVLGGAFLATVAVMTSACGARRRISTYALISEAYGEQGGKLMNVLLAGSVWGWVGVNATMFGTTLSTALPPSLHSVPVPVWTILGAAATLAIAVAGFGTINRLATAIVPLKVGLVAWTVAAAAHGYFWRASQAVDTAPSDVSVATGTSAVIGAFIVGAIMQPDVARFARSVRHARVAGVVTYGLGFPAIVLSAALPAIWLGQPDILQIMQQLGLGLLALVIIMLAAVSTNTLNLYSGSLMLATVFTRGSRWSLAAIGAAVGTTVGLLGITDVLIPWLVLMGSYAPAFAGVYIANDIVRTRFPWAARKATSAWHWDALAAATVGVLAALVAPVVLPAFGAAAAVLSLLGSVATFVALRLALSRTPATARQKL